MVSAYLPGAEALHPSKFIGVPSITVGLRNRLHVAIIVT